MRDDVKAQKQGDDATKWSISHGPHKQPDVGTWCNTFACVVMANASLGSIIPLFLCFLYHPCIFIIFVENLVLHF